MNFQEKLAEAQQVMQTADCIHDTAAVSQALDQMAASITADLADQCPLVIAVMNGGMLPLSHLIVRLNFPLTIDYLHTSRYREETTGDELVWLRKPNHSLAGRHVLIVDDILDEGHTLAEIRENCLAENPASVRSAVLMQKTHDRGVRPPLEYCGFEVPDRYVFGCGMDYKGFWRNLPAIYAIKGA